jgi:ATP-dependent Clp protease ATP-binding subunit ClpX
MNDLDEAALVRIVSEPKNSLIKQYIKLLSMDGVKLEFADGALEEIAKLALERNTGARGLRAIMESLMANIMYEIPSRADVDKVIITGATVKGGKPEYVLKRDITKQDPEA